MSSFLFIAAWLGAALRAQALGILIPAYFDPGPTGTNWDSLAAAAGRVPVAVIMNPNNGPSTSARSSYTKAIAKVRGAGGQVIGYVYSSYTNRPIADVKADIDRYNSFYTLDGIFIDEMTNDNLAAHLAYYGELYHYIKERRPTHWVVENPGINTLEGYLTRPAADTLVTFEHFTGYDSYQSDAWTQRYLPTAFSHLCYSIASSVTMTNYVQLARSRNAAYIYVTDDTANNPWDTLPSYWESEVALIEQLNRQAATNRPATLRIMVMGTNTATITVAGSPGRYVLTGSPNLEKWQPIATNVSAAGIYAVSDPAPSKLPNRAYRTEQ